MQSEGPSTETGRHRAPQTLAIEVNASRPGLLARSRDALAAFSEHPPRALRWALLGAALVVLVVVPLMNVPGGSDDTSTVADVEQPDRVDAEGTAPEDTATEDTATEDTAPEDTAPEDTAVTPALPTDGPQPTAPGSSPTAAPVTPAEAAATGPAPAPVAPEEVGGPGGTGTQDAPSTAGQPNWTAPAPAPAAGQQGDAPAEQVPAPAPAPAPHPAPTAAPPPPTGTAPAPRTPHCVLDLLGIQVCI